MKNGNVFGTDSKAYNAFRQPLWLEVKERKIGGGTIDVAGVAKGTLIPAATPVYLDKMGGAAKILDAFKVNATVSTSDTVANISPVGVYGTKLAEGAIVGKVAAGSAAKSGVLGAYNGTGFAITAGALGALTAGDYVYLVESAGSNKAAVKPNGLSWREIYIDTDNATVATVAVVTKGQILGDRCPNIPDWMKESLTGITFEYEL